MLSGVKLVSREDAERLAKAEKRSRRKDSKKKHKKVRLSVLRSNSGAAERGDGGTGAAEETCCQVLQQWLSASRCYSLAAGPHSPYVLPYV